MEVVKLYESGESENAIAKRFNVSRGTIRSRLEVSGVPIRGRSEAELLKWSQMTTKQRENQVAAAHKATLGRKATRAERCRFARGIQASCKLSPLESRYLKVFRDHSIDVIPQYAFEIYNLDFAIPSIKLAIEIDGGNWHESKPKRKYDRGKEVLLSNRGWSYIRFSASNGLLTIKVKCTDNRFIPVLNAVTSSPSLWREDSMVVSHPTTE